MVLGKTGFAVSAIGLGTVEIGLPYGIGTKTLPTDAEAEKLLKSAVEMGVTYIDTARGYGLAEERIGNSGISRRDDIVIGTKCGQFLKNEPDLRGSELEKRIREEIDTSRKLLRQDRLQLVQLHLERSDHTDLRELVEIMQRLKDEDKIAHVGIATRGEAVPLAAIKTGFFETIQTAYSILDQRMSPRVLPTARENDVGIINRSVLLKGALTPAVETLPEQLNPLKERSRRAARIAAELGMDLPTLAIRFARSNPAVSTILIGTTKPQNLQRALAAAEQGPLSEQELQPLYELAIADEMQVDPSYWQRFIDEAHSFLEKPKLV